MNLSPHFTLEEMVATQHRGIDNTPTPEVVRRLMHTAQGLEAVRVRLGGCPIIVTSGYRCPALNAAVRGQAKSQHLTGQAADFIAPRFGSPMQVALALRDSGVEYDQLIIEFGRWVHISFADRGRHQALTIDEAGTRPML